MPARFLTPASGCSLFFVVVIEQVSYTAKLFCRRLQGFDLLAQLGLLRLFLVQYLVDIPHGFCLLIAL
jgi:hypothetical protein